MPQSRLRWALFDDDKTVRDARMAQVTEKTKEHFATVDESSLPLIDEALYQTQKHVVRRALLDEGKRVDGRGPV